MSHAAPQLIDPAEGLVVAANNPTFAPPAPYFVSSQWEPVDRALRIREVLEAQPRHSLQDMMLLQRISTLGLCASAVLLLGACDLGDNCVGLANPGLERTRAEKLPKERMRGHTMIEEIKTVLGPELSPIE